MKLIVIVSFASSVGFILPQSEEKCLCTFYMPPFSMCLPMFASMHSFSDADAAILIACASTYALTAY